MRFTINTEVFQKSLAAAGRAIGGKASNPVLLSFKLDVDGKGLSVLGYNQEIAIRRTIPFTQDGKELIRNYSLGTTLLPAKLLSEVIRRVESEEVSVEIIDNSIAKIDDGKASFKIFCMNADEYPDIPFNTSSSAFELPASVLSELVDQTAFAALAKDGKPILTTINLKTENGEIVATATDSARLSKKSVAVDGISKLSANLPAKLLTEIARLPEARDVITVSINTENVVFEFGNTSVSCRLISGDYPVSSSIIPTSFNFFLEVNAKEILSAIERISVLYQGVAPVVKLSMSERSVEVSSVSSQAGSAIERIKTFRYSGERLEIAFNSIFVCDAIRALGSEDVNFSFIGEMKPFVIKNPNDESVVELITPIRKRY